MGTMKAVLIVCLLVPVAEVTGSQDVCVDGKTQNIRLTFSSYRNETGRYQTQILIAQDAGELTMSSLPWRVDVEQGVSDCQEKKVRYIQCTYNDPTYSARDYHFYPSLGRYKFHTTPRTWSEAFYVCQDEGAHLAIINSDEEAHVLKEIFQRGPKITGAEYDHVAYLGFTDMVKEGNFVTVFGTPLSAAGYSKFAPSEPNNLGGSATNPGQDCGAFFKESGLLDDSTCSWKLSFFCEQEI